MSRYDTIARAMKRLFIGVLPTGSLFTIETWVAFDHRKKDFDINACEYEQWIENKWEVTKKNGKVEKHTIKWHKDSYSLANNQVNNLPERDKIVPKDEKKSKADFFTTDMPGYKLENDKRRPAEIYLATEGDKFVDEYVVQQQIIDTKNGSTVLATPKFELKITGTFFKYDKYDYTPELKGREQYQGAP